MWLTKAYVRVLVHVSFWAISNVSTCNMALLEQITFNITLSWIVHTYVTWLWTRVKLTLSHNQYILMHLQQMTFKKGGNALSTMFITGFSSVIILSLSRFSFFSLQYFHSYLLQIRCMWERVKIGGLHLVKMYIFSMCVSVYCHQTIYPYV